MVEEKVVSSVIYAEKKQAKGLIWTLQYSSDNRCSTRLDTLDYNSLSIITQEAAITAVSLLTTSESVPWMSVARHFL